MIRKEAGISIVEFMTVIAVIAILCAIAVPGYIGWLPRYRLSTAARDVLSDLEFARATAIRVNGPVVMAFDTDNDTYRIWADNGALINRDNWNQDGDEPTLRTRETPPGILISTADFGGNPRIRFTGNGLPEVQTNPPSLGGGSVTLANTNESRVVLLSVGGKARIE